MGVKTIKVETSWCVEDVRGHFKEDVDHMTDEEIMRELENLHGAFHDKCVESGWDVIDACFEIKELV